jgi:SRSO17 transposase
VRRRDLLGGLLHDTDELHERIYAPYGIETAQVGVFLGDASPTGHALIDRELYLPPCWTNDSTAARPAGTGGSRAR